jgi:protein-disulfide isomerase
MPKSKNLPLVLFILSGIGLWACARQGLSSHPFNIIFKDPPQPGLLGKVGDKTFPLAATEDKDKIRRYEAFKKLYDFLLSEYQQQLIKEVLTKAATKANLTFEKYVDEKIASKIAKISDKQATDFAKENDIEDSKVTPELKMRIQNFLSQQQLRDAIDAEVKKLAVGIPMEAYFQKPHLDVTIATNTSPVYGNKNAAVKIFEFSDFECPFCGKAYKTLQKLKKDPSFASQVQIIFKHYPLSMHPNAKPAAIASQCALAQSENKFWEFHNELFENQKKLTKPDFLDYAKKIGLNVKAFETCLDSKVAADQVEADLTYAQNLGLNSAPSFIINNHELIAGAAEEEVFLQAVQDAAAFAKK